MTLPPTPKSQHYVWQHYLEAWATGGTIACYRQRERKAFRPGTKNIATETYFCRTYDLTERELAYLEATIAQRPNTAVHSNHRAFVAMFSMVSDLRRLVALYGKGDPDARAQSQALLDPDLVSDSKQSRSAGWHPIRNARRLAHGDIL